MDNVYNERKFRLDNEFSTIATLGEDNDGILDKICVFCLVLTPLLQHYQGVVVELSVCVLVALIPYLFIKVLKNIKSIDIMCVAVIAPLLLFRIYAVIAHGTDFLEVAHAGVVCFYYIIAACGLLNIKNFIKYGYCVAMAASIAIIMQYCCFYIFDFHLQLVPTSLLLPESDYWVVRAQTGFGNVIDPEAFYRPSAFFLEPSHMFLYLFPQLFIVLLSPNKRIWKTASAVVMTIGLILTTSGMGICVAAGAWGLYFTCSSGKDNIISLRYLFRIRNLWVIPLYLLACYLLYDNVIVIEDSINRIFVSESSSASTAIEGRTESAASVINKIEGIDVIFGVSDSTADLNCNMSGFRATQYKYGIIGLILSYAFYVFSFLKLRYHYVWISFIILIVSYFSAHTHGTFYMMYYVFILLEGWHSAKNPYTIKDLVKGIKKK